MEENKDKFQEEKTIEIAKNAQKRLSEGKSTINQIRTEYGLKPLDDESADKIFTKV
ncbi:MAG TPA: hypothetical protein GXX41_00180 [Thermoanaerobacterium sp.]|nr:hypothetical protein [Thermoanaerobacterium sp.]